MPKFYALGWMRTGVFWGLIFCPLIALPKNLISEKFIDIYLI
jgi:hypothetical protein